MGIVFICMIVGTNDGCLGTRSCVCEKFVVPLQRILKKTREKDEFKAARERRESSARPARKVFGQTRWVEAIL